MVKKSITESLFGVIHKFDLLAIIKTIIFNFKYFPFKKAIKFPILVSRNVVLNRLEGKVVLDCPVKTGVVRLGFGNVEFFDKRNRLVWTVSGTVVFKGKVRFGKGSSILVGGDGVLVIGKDFRTNGGSSIIAIKRVELGYNMMLSWDCLIMDSDFHKIRDKTGKIINEPKEIIIGNNVWIGCQNLILKGAKIPNNSVIAAGSIVSKELVGEGNVFGGNPIKAIKNEVTWDP